MSTAMTANFKSSTQKFSFGFSAGVSGLMNVVSGGCSFVFKVSSIEFRNLSLVYYKDLLYTIEESDVE
jgi:hypothetical protein